MAIGIDWICHHNLGMKSFVHDRSAIQKVIRKVEIDLYSKLTSVQIPVSRCDTNRNPTNEEFVIAQRTVEW